MARFCPFGRRCGHQNSNASMPISSGGVCFPKLDTALLIRLKAVRTPVTRVLVRYNDIVVFSRKVTKAYPRSGIVAQNDSFTFLRPLVNGIDFASSVTSGV